MSEKLAYRDVDLGPLAAMIDAYLEGLNDAEVAARIGASVNAVSYVRGLLKLPPRRRWAPDKTLVGTHGDEVHRLAARGMNDSGVARATGMSAHSVRRVRNALGIAPGRKHTCASL